MNMRHCTAILFLFGLLLADAPGTASAQPAGPDEGPRTFQVFLGGVPVGSEQVQVDRTAEGWTISASGRLGPPLSLITHQLIVRYTPDWQPRELMVEATLQEQPLSIHTTFTTATATSEVTQGGQGGRKTDDVSPRTVVLPNNFYGVYEALAARVAGLEPGARFQVYVAPQAEIGVELRQVAAERIRTPDGAIEARRHDLVFENPGGPLPVSVWTDADRRLLRVHISAGPLDVAREDIATVAARQETLRLPGDQDVMVPSAGFNLATTLTVPAAPAPPPAPGRRAPAVRHPAVVLVAGSGVQDRDGTAAGIPVLGQIAGALAAEGFLVARYDKRGTGQSGGRAEAVTLQDYAEDVRAMVRYLRGRQDVDPRRVAVVGHSEGAWVGLLAASREGRITAVATIAAPGTTGAELVLEQQRRALDRLELSDEEKRQRIDMQRRIQAAVVSGNGWDDVPPQLRRQADTPWFQSLLTFDPEPVMGRVRQPLLILQGTLDTQVPPHHAGRLAEMAEARRRGTVRVELIEGINHLLVPAATGEVDEYASLADREVSRTLLDPLIDWLRQVLPAR
jgi:uncharacterized protein